VPGIELTVELAGNNRTLMVDIDPASSAEDCTYKLWASGSRRKLSTDNIRGKLIIEADGSETLSQFKALRLKALKRSGKRKQRKVFFIVEVICDDGSEHSDIAEISVRKKKRGTLTLKQWLKRVKRNLASSDIELIEAFPGLSFTSPLDVENAGDNSNRLFVVEQGGRIIVFENSSSVSSSTVFLDISNLIEASGSEQGLLGLAFHPDYASNGLFYVNYTAKADGATVVARYQVSSQNANQADTSSALILLTVSQPFTNHNAGQIAFGPDGYLYIGLGDGGGNARSNSQDRTKLLGSLLRIDVDTASGGLNYGIPTDNPYVGNSSGFREEIFAYGLRNPWRFSFDSTTGDLWLGDVGQNAREEINLIETGANYGWPTMEGSICFPSSSSCDQTGLELPLHDYTHSFGLAVTGGYVYHGSAVESLVGAYLFGDYGSGRLWKLTIDESSTAQVSLLLNTDLVISGFGVDEDQELYVTDLAGGKVYRLS